MPEFKRWNCKKHLKNEFLKTSSAFCLKNPVSEKKKSFSCNEAVPRKGFVAASFQSHWTAQSQNYYVKHRKKMKKIVEKSV